MPRFEVPIPNPRGRHYQSNDGTAHMTYSDLPSLRSYVWDGYSESIHVSIGGYSEPVAYEIPAPAAGSSIQLFACFCRADAAAGEYVHSSWA